MTDDFETRLAALLNESVDAQLATRTAAPPFTPPVEAGSDPSPVDLAGDELAARRRRRFTFLAVAATVVAIVGAALTLNAFAPHSHPHAPATSPPATLKSVRLGGATLALPASWEVRPISRYQGGAAAPNSPTWCLTPESIPASSKTIFSCPVVFTAFTPSQSEMDPDAQGGYHGDSSEALQCFPTGDAHYREIAGTRTFGGRSAQFRQWTVTCPKKPEAGYVEQQYTVPTARGYIINSYRATPRIRAGLAVIAANSTLPRRTSSLRLGDRGYVRSVRSTAKGTRVTIGRAVLVSSGAKRNGSVTRLSGTATYLDPRSQERVNGTVHRGDLVYVATDGHAVVFLQGETP